MPGNWQQNKLHKGETLTVRASVTNTGGVSADDVIQLYIRDVVGSLGRPVRELKGFHRVRVAPGETKTIRFLLSSDDLSFFDNQERRVAEPGKFELSIGERSIAPLVA